MSRAPTISQKQMRNRVGSEKLVRLVREFERTEAKLNKQREKLNDAFRPLIDKAFKTGGPEAAFAIARQIPCCVIRALAFDRIRHSLPKNLVGPLA